MCALSHSPAACPHAETGVRIVRQVAPVTPFQPFRSLPSHILDTCMLVVWRHTVCPAKFALLRYCWGSSACRTVFPNRPVMNIPLLQAYSVNKVTVLRLQCALESVKRAHACAPTHTRAPGSPPPDGVRGGGDPRGARVVWVVEYMCIYEPGHIRCRFRTRCRFRPDPSLRFAALRGRVLEPRFDPFPSQAPGSLRPCGVRVKGAAALGRRSPTRPRRFLAPGGEAFLGSPC